MNIHLAITIISTIQKLEIVFIVGISQAVNGSSEKAFAPFAGESVIMMAGLINRCLLTMVVYFNTYC